MNRKELIINNIAKLILLYLFTIVLFLVIRFLFIIYFGKIADFHDLLNNIGTIFFNSVRFDTVVSLFAYLIILFFILLFLIIPKVYLHKYDAFFKMFFSVYSLVILVSFIVVSSLDFYFFLNYNNHFDALIFAFKNDSTVAIMKSIWADYPVLLLVLFWIVFGVILRKVVRLIRDYRINSFIKSPVLFYASILLFIGIFFIGLRGSIGMFPLKIKHAYVTENQFLNKMTINGVFALKSVLSKGENKNNINSDYKKALTKNGFTEIEQALKIHLNDTVKRVATEKLFFKTTNENKFLVENPPNVVFLLVESFGTHFLNLHTKECNMLGSLEDELDNLFVFKNFLSSGNITVSTFENILVGSTFSPISQTPFKNISLSSSIVIPFNNANYTTNFVYSGEYGWRNIGTYCKTQGFKNVITQKNIEKDYPSAVTNPWGVHDEYVYKKIISILEKEKQPQFVFALTTSNHSPYELPNHYKQIPIKISDSILDKMLINEKLTYKSFLTFQYTADQIGQFIKQIKNSGLGENTIIAITGDHSSHKSFDYSITENFYKRKVPLLLYIPKKYQNNLSDNLKVFGSHKDIFPTLYNISLSDIEYFNTGENLFNTNKSFSLNAFNFAANKFGAIIKGEPTTYYKWKKNNILMQLEKKNTKLDSLEKKMKAYNAIMDYHIMYEFEKKNESK